MSMNFWKILRNRSALWSKLGLKTQFYVILLLFCKKVNMYCYADPCYWSCQDCSWQWLLRGVWHRTLVSQTPPPPCPPSPFYWLPSPCISLNPLWHRWGFQHSGLSCRLESAWKCVRITWATIYLRRLLRDQKTALNFGNHSFEFLLKVTTIYDMSYPFLICNFSHFLIFAT